MLRVIEYFAKSLKVIRNDTLDLGVLLVFHCNYVCLVPFLRYTASNNDMTLKYGLEVIQGHCNNDTIQ